MVCKHCNSPLPPTGFVCRSCGMMMSEEQIKIQKESIKANSNLKAELVSEKYGHKDYIYQKREDIKPKFMGIFILIAIIFIVILLALFVYLK